MEKAKLAEQLQKVFTENGIDDFVVVIQKGGQLDVMYPPDLPHPISFVRSIVSAYQRALIGDSPNRTEFMFPGT